MAFSLVSSAQVTENFGDGDFTNNPTWTGNATDWMVNANSQLQSNNTTVNSTFYLSTANTLATATKWEFYLRLNFNTSSANYVDVFLTASAADLSLNTTTGYFVRIGNTQDDICLYRKDASGTAVKIIDGVDGTTNFSDNMLKIKVIRTAGNQFMLYRDVSGTGTNYFSEGVVTDATYTTSSFFGFLVKQSTAGFFQKHFFNDIIIQPYVPDLTPPAIQSVSPASANILDVLFSEPVDLPTAQTLLNYNCNNGIGSPVTAQRDAANNAIVHLIFPNNFPNGINNTITINGVQDLAGNAINNGMAVFSFYIPQAYDVVMEEIMADPTPSVSLPNAEFIELKNVSGRTLDLAGWKLSASASASGFFSSFILLPDSFLVLTSTSNAVLFGSSISVMGVPNFPSLPNEGGQLALVSKEGRTIHAVNYSDSWYRNAIKKDGGWTLEMIDTHSPCTGMDNWKASINTNGGTPGKKNSLDAINNDPSPPVLLRTYSTDSLTVIALFDEPLDSTSGAVGGNYGFSNGILVASAVPQGPFFNEVVLKLSQPMQKRIVYLLTVNGLADCKGNAIGAHNKAKAGWAEEVFQGDIVLNEILFDPRYGASDYVEVLNKSNKIVDANKAYIANRNSSNGIASIKKWSGAPFYIFPDEYILLTEDALSVQQEYLVENPGNVLVVPVLPSYPDDKGNVLITNSLGDVVDEVAYSSKWHFALIGNPEGVALERIDPNGKSGDAANWHSAASTAGYGTPSYKNSQYRQSGNTAATIEVSPKIFSPDNDGHDDVAAISYRIDEPGYAANLTIFDANGRLVRYLVKNDVLGLKGNWTWDGLDDKNQKLPIGTYIIYTEIFNLQGKKKQFKNTVVLARSLN
jgi:hypothetical protein